MLIARIWEVWLGAKLEVVNESWQLFGGESRPLTTDNWSVYKVEEAHNDKRCIFLTLNVECREALCATSLNIGFGFTSIYKNSFAASNTAAANSFIETPSDPCEAEKLVAPDHLVLKPLEDDLCLAVSSLPFPDNAQWFVTQNF